MSSFLKKKSKQKNPHKTPKQKPAQKTPNQNSNTKIPQTKHQQNPASAAFVNTRMNAANTPIPTDEYLSHFEMKYFHFNKYTAQ